MEGSNPCEEVAKTEVSNVSKPVVPIVPDVITNLPALSSASNPPAVSAPANVPAASEAPTVPPASTPVHVPPADTSTDAVVSTPSSANPCTVPKTAPAPTPSKPADSKHTPTPAVKPVVTPQQSNARATSLPSAASEASVKNRSSRDEKARKKDDKSMDHVLRALHSLSTPEEKLAALCQKYSDLFDEHRKLQALQKQTEKRCSMLQREKEQLTGEHSKAILTRSRLENLCRELQRQNKAIKDESLLKIREEEEKRKDVSAKFQTTMNEITSLMQQNNDKNMKLRDDNIDMTAKLKSICEQYELRQQQVDRISKQMQLEQQLADAKLSKLKLEMAAERETLLKEKQQLLMELQQYQQRCNEFQGTEVNLRNQISMYNDKYDEFQKALARSNDVFGGFKGEMEKMSKKICKLEKETSSWKQRWERSHRALLEMAADKQKSEQELGVVSRQLATLQGLCRTLQTERATLTAKLKLLQAGGQDCSEVADIQPSQQSEQTVNNLEPVTPSGQPMCVQGLNSWTKEDVLASLINSCPPLPIESNDTSQPISGIPIPDTKTLSAPNPGASTPVVPTPSTPSVNSLPNVVGASSVCPVDQTPEVNSDLTKQFQNITVNEIVSLSEEKHSPSQENVLETGVSEETQVYSVGSSITEVSNQPVIAEKPNDNSTAVLNGDAQTTVVNGLPTSLQKDVETPLNQLSPAVKDSPTKSPETGKKSKESAKKKKK